MRSNLNPQQPNIAAESSNQGKSLYQCQYCRSYFSPKKRFVQKYCSESCRVMACRDRNKPKSTPASKTFHGFSGGRQENYSSKKQKTNISNSEMEEIKDYIDDMNRKILKEISSLKSKQDYHMLISGLVTFLAGPIREKLIMNSSSQDQKKSMEEILKQLEKIQQFNNNTGKVKLPPLNTNPTSNTKK